MSRWPSSTTGLWPRDPATSDPVTSDPVTPWPANHQLSVVLSELHVFHWPSVDCVSVDCVRPIVNLITNHVKHLCNATRLEALHGDWPMIAPFLADHSTGQLLSRGTPPRYLDKRPEPWTSGCTMTQIVAKIATTSVISDDAISTWRCMTHSPSNNNSYFTVLTFYDTAETSSFIIEEWNMCDQNNPTC